MQREQQALHTEHKIQQEEEELEVLSQQKQVQQQCSAYEVNEHRNC
jgi:hypothetical protein